MPADFNQPLATKVPALVVAGTVNAVHDISDGGLIVTIAEMALAGERAYVVAEVNEERGGEKQGDAGFHG